MFDWFWEFLYGITKSILRLIDGLISCANKLCGIEPISVDGQETDFMTYVVTSQSITDGFKIAAILGLIILVFFTIFRILMVIAKEKPDMSPGQVCIKAFKTLLTFLFVPTIMVTLIVVLNTFMKAMYAATTNGRQSLGSFLFEIFSKDAVTNPGQWESIVASESGYMDTDSVAAAIALDDFDYLLSWITGIVLIINLGNALLTFVDRAISIAVLFVVSPFSIASSVLDDGQRFKLWREQVLLKFIIGYGMIIFFNIYCLIVGLITPASVVFFSSGFLNGVFKLLIILGGGYAMLKSVAIIGNLISAGAGSREMMDAHVAGIAGKMAGAVGSIGKGAWKLGKWAYGKAKGSGKDKGSDSKSDGKSEGESSEGGGDNNSSGEPMDKNPKFNQNYKIEDTLKNSDNGESKDNDKNESSNDNKANIDNASGANNLAGSNQNSNKNELNKKREKDIKDALKTGGQPGENK